MDSEITVKGKFGTLQTVIPNTIHIIKNDKTLIIDLKIKTRSNRKLHGLYRTLINNMIIGVSEQFQLSP